MSINQQNATGNGTDRSPMDSAFANDPRKSNVIWRRQRLVEPVLPVVPQGILYRAIGRELRSRVAGVDREGHIESFSRSRSTERTLHRQRSRCRACTHQGLRRVIQERSTSRPYNRRDTLQLFFAV